jgi:DUF4097 and DUF4098 domain-containing protein YvlB
VIRYLAIALVLMIAGPASAAEKTFDRTFTVSAGGSLKVEADGADVRVSGNDSNQVVVHMVYRGSQESADSMKLDAVQKDDTVDVTMRRAKRSWLSWIGSSSEGTVEVTVPRRFAVDVRTGGGGITLRDTVGAATLNTSGGDVTARNLTGNIELRTSGGTILAESIRGDVDADTSGGDVRLMQIDGVIRGNTSGGSVRCALKGANRGITATTSGGDVELLLPRATAGNLEATTSGGQIKTEIPVTTTTVKEGRLEGPVNGGGPLIKAHTSGGNIALRVAD